MCRALVRDKVAYLNSFYTSENMLCLTSPTYLPGPCHNHRRVFCAKHIARIFAMI